MFLHRHNVRNFLILKECEDFLRIESPVQAEHFNIDVHLSDCFYTFPDIFDHLYAFFHRKHSKCQSFSFLDDIQRDIWMEWGGGSLRSAADNIICVCIIDFSIMRVVCQIDCKRVFFVFPEERGWSRCENSLIHILQSWQIKLWEVISGWCLTGYLLSDISNRMNDRRFTDIPIRIWKRVLWPNWPLMGISRLWFNAFTARSEHSFDLKVRTVLRAFWYLVILRRPLSI